MKTPKMPFPFSSQPVRRNGASRSGGAKSGSGGNRWKAQNLAYSERAQARSSEKRSSSMPGSRVSGGGSRDSSDLDLVSALGARAANQSSSATLLRDGNSLDPGKAGGRTGGRIRMDSPKSVRTGPRVKAIPNAPRYRPNARPVNWRAIFLTTFVVLIAAYSLTFLFSSPTLALRSVEIDGVSPATAQLLQADMPGEPIGSNVFRYALANRRAIRKSIGGAEADFKTVGIGIHLPHTLVVTIVKRAPVALLVVGGESWALDNRGIPIRRGDDSEIAGMALPRIEAERNVGESNPVPALGRDLSSELAQQVSDGLAILKALRGQPGLSSVHTVRLDSLRNATLVLSNNLLIKLGQPIQIAPKLALANTLMQQHPDVAAQADYIDVSYPERPAMLPKGTVVKPAAPSAADTAQSAGPDSGATQTSQAGSAPQ